MRRFPDVIPAKAGIQFHFNRLRILDAGFPPTAGHDERTLDSQVGVNTLASLRYLLGSISTSDEKPKAAPSNSVSKRTFSPVRSSSSSEIVPSKMIYSARTKTLNFHAAMGGISVIAQASDWLFLWQREPF